MFVAYLLSSFSYLSGIGLNVTSGWLITMASFMPPVLTLNVAVVMVRFFGISRSVTRYGERIASHTAVFTKLSSLRSDLYRRITSRPFELLKNQRTGQLVKQVVDDVERTQEYELRIILPGVTGVITLIAATGLAMWLQPRIAIIWFIDTLLLGFAIPKFVNRICLKSAQEIEMLEGNYSNQLRKTSHGLMEAEIYGYLDQLQAETSIMESEIANAEIGLLNRIRILQLIVNLIVAVTLLATFLLVKVPAVQVAMLVFLSLTGFEAILAWYPNLFSAGKLIKAKQNLLAIPESLSNTGQTAVFDSLSAKNFQPYWDQPFIKPIDFELHQGEVLVLRGPSGIGKSTIAMGVLGLINYEGSLKVDGIEVKSISNLSNIVVGSLQNGHIFNTSLRENLNISNKEFGEVLQLLELEDLVKNLPEGLDTLIGEFGRGLSGGELKRINLARALINDSPVLVLDEPLEHLDPELGIRVERAILNKYKDRALLIITHSGFRGLPELILERVIEN